MKSINEGLRKGLIVLTASFVLLQSFSFAAASEGDSLDTLNAGAAIILDADISLEKDELDKIAKDATNQSVSGNQVSQNSISNNEIEQKEEKVESTLVMANVNDSANVRTEANEESEKAGKLYKDCGGEILERSNGWTKIKSGDLVGWVKDNYLLFDEEAKKMAEDVGHLLATVNADALRVRKGTSEDAGVFGLVGKGEVIDVIDHNNEWVTIDYEGDAGYISAEFVSVDFKLDHGETMAVIQERERKEAEEKAKLTQNRGAVPVGATDVELLAALIQCEAGGESYEGQLAVGAVVMNRVRSGGYPNTMQGVIYASGQFTPALNGKVAARVSAGSKASCMQAAQEAINGVSNVGGATHFRRAGSRDGVVIGNHVFW